MIERYIRHIFKEQYNKDISSIVITDKHEYTSTTTDDIVFYTVRFKFTDTVKAHDNCSIVLKVDFHSYESNDEMYCTFLQITYN